MKLNIFPGYENHLAANTAMTSGESEKMGKRRQAQGQALMSYTLPDGMKMEDKVIPGGDDQDMTIRIYTPANIMKNAPMVLDIHGGGFVAGSMDTDNARCIALAVRIPAIVVGVEYRVSKPNGTHFPSPLMDCVAAYRWMVENGASIGADGSRIGLHGSSSGGNQAEGLALYLRDHNIQTPSLTVLNCATYIPGIAETMSYQQLIELKMGPDNKALGAEATYLGGYDGTLPSYYSFPGLCYDVEGLGPHMIICAEYDTLRDSGLDYARRLLNAAVPTELFLGGRLCHCFTSCPHPYTDQIHDLIATSFKREFGLLDELKK